MPHNEHNHGSHQENGFSLMEMGALIQRVDYHAEKFDLLEHRIEKGIDSLTEKFDNFLTQYNADKPAYVGSSNYSKGVVKESGRLKHYMITIFVSMGGSSLAIAVVNKLFNLHLTLPSPPPGG